MRTSPSPAACVRQVCAAASPLPALPPPSPASGAPAHHLARPQAILPTPPLGPPAPHLRAPRPHSVPRDLHPTNQESESGPPARQGAAFERPASWHAESDSKDLPQLEGP
eukprot:4328643-Pyramimonas_sp.AAC.2